MHALSKIENRKLGKSKIENRKSKIENRKSKIENRKSK
ncbi:6-phosphofructokinase, partial [Pseudomonas syringae pv. theae]|nr:6-phosphofructokinase [Pseudomonas syringae pv. theae]